MKNLYYILFIAILSAVLYVIISRLASSNILVCPVCGFDLMMILFPSLFILFHLLLTAVIKDEKKFIRRFMLVLTLKFLSLLLILLFGLLINRDSAKCYVLTFLFIYIPLLIFETITLQRTFVNRK